ADQQQPRPGLHRPPGARHAQVLLIRNRAPSTSSGEETTVDLNLKDKVVVVTGGSSGIGLAAARTFAEEGARVVIAARRPDVLAEAAAAVTAATGVRVDHVAT